MVTQVRLQVAFDIHGQTVLQEGADFSAIGTMAVTHREEVTELEAHYVRIGDVGILVYFVRVVCRYAALCSE